MRRSMQLPIEWLKRAARQTPEKPALVTIDESISYARLMARLARLANGLTQSGIKRGDCIAILCQESRRILWALYVSLYSGYRLLPLSTQHVSRMGEKLIRDCGARVILADDALSGELPTTVQFVSAELLDASTDTQSSSPRPLSGDHVQLFMSTSGTSGAPRAAMLTGTNLAASVQSSSDRITLGDDDTWLVCLPLYHIGGLAIALRCAFAGATMFLHEGFNAYRVWEDIVKNRVTHVSLVPAMLDKLLAVAGSHLPPSHLRCVLVGGGSLGTVLARKAHAAGWLIFPTYGLTEAASQVATRPGIEPHWKSGDVGRPLPGIGLSIVDRHGKPASGLGRIHLSGPNVSPGYADTTQDRCFSAFIHRITTSDLGYLDTRGHLHIRGRADKVIVSGGENVHPLEVEDSLRRCPSVRDVAVTGKNDPVWGQCIVAVMVADDSIERIDAWCRQNTPSPLRPREFFLVEKIPRTRLGKTDRAVLKELVSRAYRSR